MNTSWSAFMIVFMQHSNVLLWVFHTFLCLQCSQLKMMIADALKTLKTCKAAKEVLSKISLNRFRLFFDIMR